MSHPIGGFFFFPLCRAELTGTKYRCAICSSGYDALCREFAMIRKLPFGKYRLYSRKKNPKTGRRRNLGTFASRAAAEKHERAVQYFKRH
jgi:hypothetical protein